MSEPKTENHEVQNEKDLEAVSGGRNPGDRRISPLTPSEPSSPRPDPAPTFDLWCNTCQAFVAWDVSVMIAGTLRRHCPGCGGNDVECRRHKE